MREIDPQSEARLTEALRRLASASRQSAPEELGAELLGQFRRHHARRRWMQRGGLVALAACLGLAAVWSLRSLPQHRSTAEIANSVVVNPEAPTPPAATPGVQQAQKVPVTHKRVKPPVSAANRPFLALPAYDPTVPIEDLQVVRVKLPASALWQIGAPVPPEITERRLTADFVVGQDGTAYAVRLVQ